MQDKAKDLCIYRIKSALETLEVARICIESKSSVESITQIMTERMMSGNTLVSMTSGLDLKV